MKNKAYLIRAFYLALISMPFQFYRSFMQREPRPQELFPVCGASSALSWAPFDVGKHSFAALPVWDNEMRRISAKILTQTENVVMEVIKLPWKANILSQYFDIAIETVGIGHGGLLLPGFQSQKLDNFIRRKKKLRLGNFRFRWSKKLKTQEQKANSDKKILTVESRGKRASQSQSTFVILWLDSLIDSRTQGICLKDLMPNTLKFFSPAGYISPKNYAAAEWTMPSTASIFTGLHTLDHKMWHPRVYQILNSETETVAERLKKIAQIACIRIGSPPVNNPLFGFSNGFDYTLHQYGMQSEKAFQAFISSWKTLQNISCHKLFFISLFDLHRSPKFYGSFSRPFMHNKNKNINLASQNLCEGTKGPLHSFSQALSNEYFEDILIVDKKLQLFYDLFDKHFQNNHNAIVLICSDHGVTFVGHDKNVMSDNRIRTPLMIREAGGFNLHHKLSKVHLTSNTQIVPFLEHALLSTVHTKFDTKMPLGDFSSTKGFNISESVYPSQEYVVRLIDESGFDVTFTSRASTGNNGFISELNPASLAEVRSLGDWPKELESIRLQAAFDLASQRVRKWNHQLGL